jgi:acetoin utilization protein AcuA
MKGEKGHKIHSNTSMGKVEIRTFCTPGEIRKYQLDGQFSTHARFKSLYTKRESLEEIAGQTDSNVALALADDRQIIGFGVLAYPEPGERWSELEPHVMIEVRAIEVARSWRSEKIASRVLKSLVVHPKIEDKIAYMAGYSWTWDLEYTHKTGAEYRKMLQKIFASCGFQEYQTNEPNISLKTENLFMCRIGKNVSEVILNRFKWLRFGLSPWTWTD